MGGDLELDAVELSGERLTLRRWHPDDAERVRAIMQDPSMHEYLSLPEPYTAEAAHHFVTELGHEGRPAGRGLGCAVVERSTGRVVGSAALRLDPADTGRAEVGYWIAPDARGHGYAAEATRVLTGFAFTLDRLRVRLDCDVTNLASARTALAAGFRFEGISRDATPTPWNQHSATGCNDLARFARLRTDPGTPVAATCPPLPALTDGTITLRPVRPGDADEVAECGAELARADGSGGAARSARDAERSAARAGLDWLVGTHVQAAIVDEATGALAGVLRLRLADPPRVAAIGYVVHPLFRGRGCTERALRLLVPWALDAGFVRLELGSKATDLAAQRTALDGGFEPDGVLRGRLLDTDGTVHDEVRFALLADGS